MENLSHIADRQQIFKLGAWSCIILMVYSLATILIVSFLGGPPETVSDCFEMLRQNRMQGLLRLDILTVFIMPLYIVIFYAVYLALKEMKPSIASLSSLFIFIGVALFLAAPSVFSYLRLSDSYWGSTTDLERSYFRSAAEAILASDIWNGTGPRIGGLLIQSGATIISILMLRSPHFSRLTAYTGILTHGLDLLHIIIGFFIPALANGIMGVAGILYLFWFAFITIDLFRLIRVSPVKYINIKK
jgi:hypothetical protein